MLKVRLFGLALLMAGSLCVSLAGAKADETPSESAKSVRLGEIIKAREVENERIFAPKAAPVALPPISPVVVNLRGGALVSPTGAALVGADVSLPQLSLGQGFKGRFDADVLFKSSFARTNTIFPVTFDQIYYRPQVGKNDIYLGGGIGAILGDGTTFLGKLVVGVTLTQKVSAELNVLFGQHDTGLTLMGRLAL
jgi:hypothetical protein